MPHSEQRFSSPLTIDFVFLCVHKSEMSVTGQETFHVQNRCSSSGLPDYQFGLEENSFLTLIIAIDHQAGKRPSIISQNLSRKKDFLSLETSQGKTYGADLWATQHSDAPQAWGRWTDEPLQPTIPSVKKTKRTCHSPRNSIDFPFQQYLGCPFAKNDPVSSVFCFFSQVDKWQRSFQDSWALAAGLRPFNMGCEQILA